MLTHTLSSVSQGDGGIFVLFCFIFTNAVMEPGQIFHDIVHKGGKGERVITQEMPKYTHTHTHLLTDPPIILIAHNIHTYI